MWVPWDRLLAQSPLDPGKAVESPPQISVSDSDWQRTPRAVQGLVVSLGERVAHLEQSVEQQTARIAALEQELARRKGRGRRGAQASASSGSSDRASQRRSSGRSPGGQPGHEGHGRSLMPAERVDQWTPVKPSACHRCGGVTSRS